MLAALMGTAFGVGVSADRVLSVVLPGFVVRSIVNETPPEQQAPGDIYPGPVLLAMSEPTGSEHAAEVPPTRISDRLTVLERELTLAEVAIDRSTSMITPRGEGFCFRACVAATALIEQRRDSVDLYRRLVGTTWGRGLGGWPGTLRDPLPGAVWAGGLGWAVRPADGVNRYHDGIDLTLPQGSPIRAAAAGTVERVGPRAGYGIAVEIRHTDGYSTLYAHMSVETVARGQQVVAGEVIGEVGATGLAGSPHLHFEYKDSEGNKLDPIAYL